MFRQVTGYNYIQAGNFSTIADDYGNGPAPGDAAMCWALADTMETARMMKNMNGDPDDLTSGEIQNMLKWQEGGTGDADKNMFDTLMKAVKAADAEDQTSTA